MFSTFFSFAGFTYCHADTGPGRTLVDSVVMISVPGGACATGFVDTEGRIFTNSHVTRSLCSFGSCGSVRVQRASAVGRFPDEDVLLSELTVVSDIPSIDMAVLEQEGEEPLRGVFGSFIAATAGQPVSVLGFPRCHTLELGKGEVLRSDSLRVYTSARIAHGSSGSPIFDENMNLVGMVDEASTILGGLDSLIFGGRFEGRGVNASAMKRLLDLPSRASLLEEAMLLNELAETQVKGTNGSRRLREGLELVDRVDGFLQRMALLEKSEPGLTNGFTIMRDLSLFPRTPSVANQLGREIEALSLTAALEENGFIGPTLAAMDPDGLIEALKTSGREPEHVARLEKIIENFKESGYLGSVWLVSLLVVAAAGLLGLAFAVWGWTLGYVFATLGGGLLWKIACTAFIGLFFWPFSFLVYIWSGRKAAG